MCAATTVQGVVRTALARSVVAGCPRSSACTVGSRASNPTEATAGRPHTHTSKQALLLGIRRLRLAGAKKDAPHAPTQACGLRSRTATHVAAAGWTRLFPARAGVDPPRLEGSLHRVIRVSLLASWLRRSVSFAGPARSARSLTESDAPCMCKPASQRQWRAAECQQASSWPVARAAPGTSGAGGNEAARAVGQVGLSRGSGTSAPPALASVAPRNMCRPNACMSWTLLAPGEGGEVCRGRAS